MLRDVLANTNVAFYLMAATGILGILAKIVNQLTLRNLLRASGNMSKSTHRLIKLVRAKYEHTCMIHDTVENIDAFVEKYIYEYRGFIFRIHTWRQIELLVVWFAGILAALGAGTQYMQYGFTETVYRYLAAGVAEVILLSVVQRLSDEPYKINAVKMYMVDYLENICTFRFRRMRQTERNSDGIDVIAGENAMGAQGRQALKSGLYQNENQMLRQTEKKNNLQKNSKKSERGTSKTGGGVKSLFTKKKTEKAKLAAEPEYLDDPYDAESEFYDDAENGQAYDGQGQRDVNGIKRDPVSVNIRDGEDVAEHISGEKYAGSFDRELSISIEGEPRNVETKKRVQGSADQTKQEGERPALREEAIRQILEEFLA